MVTRKKGLSIIEIAPRSWFWEIICSLFEHLVDLDRTPNQGKDRCDPRQSDYITGIGKIEYQDKAK